MTLLKKLHRDIDTRIHTIRQDQPDWLCGKGCDTCCRRLAEIPQLTTAEWRVLQEGLGALAPAHLEEIRRKTKALPEQTSRPLICPMLDPDTGACPVYTQRPITCRTYGFYVQRNQGLYCQDIKALVDDGKLENVIWGNHDNIDRQLSQSGESLNLTEWFTRWEASASHPDK